MPLICVLNLLAKSLDSSLTASTESLNDVGRTKSINSFEVEMRNWATAFFLYTNSANVHFERCFIKHDNQSHAPEFPTKSSLLSVDYAVTKNLLDYSSSSIMNLTQELFDVLQHEVEKSVLIPRVKNHLTLGTTKLRGGFLDYHELIVGLISQNQHTFSDYHLNNACTTRLVDDEVDNGKWVVGWMKCYLQGKDLETINAVQKSR